MKRNRLHKTCTGLRSLLGKALRMRNAMPCVGLIVLAGCLTFIVAPDQEPSFENRVTSFLSPALPTVIIDAGHGGKDNGASANGLREKDVSLDVACRLEKLLSAFGFRTVLTRRDDTFVALPERSALANQYDHALFLSIHFNEARDRGTTGIETFYASEKIAPEAEWTWLGFFSAPEPMPGDNGEALAGAVQTALVSRMDAVNRGIKKRPLYVVRHTRCPAILVEAGFLNNPLDAQLISNGEYRERLARAIAEGVMTYQRDHGSAATPKPKLAQALP